MSGKDLTNPRGEAGSFRYGTNRKVEITLRRELDDLAKKSVVEIANKREERRQAPLDQEQQTARKLQPAFTPKKVKEKRKTEPVFHEDILEQEPKFLLKPVVPPYNSLDKPDKKSLHTKTKKMPFSKDVVLSTEEFKRPHVSSLGVVPTRSSKEIPGLKVVLEGQPAVTGEDKALEQIVEANKMRPLTPGSQSSTPGQTPQATARKDVTALEDEPPKKKPAILMSEGTLQRAAFLERQKPVIPASSLKKRPRKAVRSGVQSSLSVASSLRSENINLPDDNVYSKYDDAIAGMDDDFETAVGAEDKSPALSTGTVKSTKDLLEEAKRITRKGAEPMWKLQGRKSPRKKEGKKDKKDKKEKEKAKVKEEEGDGVVRPRSERSVDEIIASLRAQSSGAGTQLSDADKKIQEIMDRVMSRTSAVLSDDSQAGETPDLTKRADSVLGSDKGSRTPLPDGATPSPTTDDEKLKEVSVPQQIPEDEELKITEDVKDADQKLPAPSEDKTVTSEVKTGEEVTKEVAVADGKAQVVPPLKLDEPMPADLTESEEEEELSPETLDIKQAWEDLMAPPHATFEDIISISGQPLDLQERQPHKTEPSSEATVQSSSVSFLSTWKPISREKYELPPLEEDRKSSSIKHVHHFCTVTSDYQLPEEFRHLGRKYHAPSRFEGHQTSHPIRFGSRGPSFVDVVDEETRSVMSRMSQTRETEEQRLASAAQRVLEKADIKPEQNVEEEFEAWQQRAEEVFQTVKVEGAKIPLQRDESRLYWTPAPPKLDVPPAKVRDVLFPEYQPAALGVEAPEVIAARQEEVESSEESEEEEEVPDLAQDRYDEIFRVVFHKSDSVEDISELVSAKRRREEDIRAGRIDPYEKRKKLQEEEEEEEKTEEDEGSREATPAKLATRSGEMEDSEIFPVFVPLRRSRSDPGLKESLDDTLLVPQDFNTAMEEITTQKANIRQMKLNKKLAEIQRIEEEERIQRMMEEAEREPTEVKPVETVSKKDEPTPAELALAAGRAYVILPKKSKKKKKRGPVNMARIEELEKFLRQPPNELERSRSMTRIPKPLERELRVPAKVRQGRKNSLPGLLNFDAYAKSKKMPPDCEDVREWVRDIWNVWFDQVYPPTPSESEESEYEVEPDEQQIQDKEKEKQEKRRKDSLSSFLSDSISVIEPLADSEQSMELQQIIYEEIEKLTNSIAASPKPKAFDLCRRGGLYRKVGMVKAAEVDLDLAIKLEPNLLDAYWHRHLLYLLQDKKDLAKKDLQYITKYNLSHAGAYRSMAEILRKEGQFSDAIINYQKAIKLNPKDHEAYFQLAAMYEKTGQMTLALDNYMMCKKILPTRTDAILKHGMYYFNQRNWNTAITDFTDLLKVDPLNANARMFRGRAFAELQQWNSAVEDLSASIHLDPMSWEAFFHRACILRKAHPKHALHDYSVSLLINDTDQNVMSYLHRGILYNSMNRFEDAIPDFESVLKLNKDIACAHVNLGLIFMHHYENYHRAIKKFSAAIKVDPTYVRAYVCRGEAYHKIHELRSALNDFTRAIHLRPDVNHYYMYRGQLVLELGNLDLAAFCVRMFVHGAESVKKPQMLGFRHASELSSDSTLGQMPTQQAVVQSFLKNYEKAIEALVDATKVKPVPPLFMLLGKTQMKAKEFDKAIISFDKALQLYKPWRREPWPMEASEAHFLIALCHMELKNYGEAKESFTSAVKINPNYAEALYQRGIAKMRLSSRGLSREGIQDFNRALAINPKIFQAYLSRACYYGMKKNYTKAILNCNEAIKIQPRSVRSYLYRGALKYHIMAYDLAIRDLDIATSIDSMCELAYFNRAVCYQEKKEYQKALKDYGIVLLLGEDEKLKAKVLINRGLLYFERKDYTNALYDFKMAAKLDPADHRILHTLGLCYHKMDRLKEAVAVFTSCVERNPFFKDGIIARGNVYMDYGSKGGLIYARRDYERVLLQNPLHLPARVNLAYTLQVSGKFLQAWNQFTTAIEIKPTFKPALEGRAIVNLQMSNTFAAYQDICASIKVSPTAELLTNRGVVNQFMQDRVNAMKDYQSAIKMDSTYSLAYFNAANVYFHTRHFRMALEYYGKAIEHNPKDESAFLNRAITKVMLRDAEGALSDFRFAIKLSPYTAHMYFNRGNLYASLEQFDKAEADYSKALSLKPDDALVLKRRADVLGKLGRKSEAIKDYRHAIEIQSQLAGEK